MLMSKYCIDLKSIYDGKDTQFVFQKLFMKM